jgi:tripartite-type tricarboxylate transporter receptor subunit TctC
LATTPGVPAERVAALRKAFQDMLKDPEFIADAKRIGADIHPMPGEQLADIIRSMISLPADVRQRVKLAIEPKESDVAK